MKVIIRPNGVVVDKAKDAEIVSNGIFMNGVIYGEPFLQLITTKSDPEIEKEKYSDGLFVPNADYVEPVDLQEKVVALEKENAELRQQVSSLSAAVKEVSK